MDSIKIAITGIRPSKLKTGYNYDTPINRIIVGFIAKCILNEAGDKDIDLYVGGALGIDHLGYLAGILLQNNGHNVRIILCIPYKNQPTIWKDSKMKEFYNNMVKSCDVVVYVDKEEGYIKCDTPEGEHADIKLHQRNHFMVDHCEVVLGFHNGTPGGTSKCMGYAVKQGKKVTKIRIDKFVEDTYKRITGIEF